MTVKKHYSLLVLIFFIGVVLFFHVFGYYGHLGYDDMTYAQLSDAAMKGNFNANHPFSYRLIVAFISLSYTVFGVSDFSSSLPALIVSISALILIYVILKRFGSFQVVIGLALTTLMTTFLMYTDKIMPDIFVAFFSLLAFYWVDQYKFYATKNTIRYAFLFSWSLFFSFLSKETAVLLLPWVVLLFYLDYRQRRDLKFWLYSLYFGVLAVVLYLIWMRMATGGFFTRVDVILSSRSTNLFDYSYDEQPFLVVLHRICFDLFRVFTQEGLIVGFLFLGAALFPFRFGNIIKIEDSESFYTLSAVVLLFSANFMTISPTSYHPLPTDPRHSIFLLPIAAIAASFSIKSFVYKKSNKNKILWVCVILAAYTGFTEHASFYQFYLPLLVLLSLYSFFTPLTKTFYLLFLGAFVVILFVAPLKYFKYSSSHVDYPLQKEIAYRYFIESKEPCIVFTDRVQMNIGNYYLKFDTNANCRFIDYTDPIPTDLPDGVKKYLYLNFHTQFYSNSFDRMPLFTKNADETYKKIFENKEHGIGLYEMNGFDIGLEGKKNFSSMNDFEAEYPNWDYDSKILSNEVFYSKNKSAEMIEYPCTFSVSCDSIMAGKQNDLYIQVSLKNYFITKPSATIVFILENAQGVYYWERKDVDRNIILERWLDTSRDMIIRKNTIKENSRLKIYLWNHEKNKGFIDDFEIACYGI
jgi:hypothetical protein